VLFQNTYYLLFAKPVALHSLVLLVRPELTLKWISYRGQGRKHYFSIKNPVSSNH
jgi:hypothetical protein